MTQPKAYEPEPARWGNCSIDKVSFFTLGKNLMPATFLLYATGPITAVQEGNHAFLNFHAECIFPGRSIVEQILSHLYCMANAGAFNPVFTRQILSTYLYGSQLGAAFILDWFASNFGISQIEMAFDFVGEVPWTILDHSQFNHVETTLYSKDYLQKTRVGSKGQTIGNGVKRSLVCIYDHATCHRYEGAVTRFELRHCGTYAEKWNFLRLNRPFDQLLGKYANQIAGSLHKAMSPKSIRFDLEAIGKTHPLLVPILARWASWGKRPVKPKT